VITVADLQDEIATMRMLMRRAFDLASDYNDLAHALSAVNVLGAVSARIAIPDLGINKKDAHRWQTLAENDNLYTE
jgi:hypothetical protein